MCVSVRAVCCVRCTPALRRNSSVQVSIHTNAKRDRLDRSGLSGSVLGIDMFVIKNHLLDVGIFRANSALKAASKHLAAFAPHVGDTFSTSRALGLNGECVYVCVCMFVFACAVSFRVHKTEQSLEGFAARTCGKHTAATNGEKIMHKLSRLLVCRARLYHKCNTGPSMAYMWNMRFTFGFCSPACVRANVRVVSRSMRERAVFCGRTLNSGQECD